VASEAAPVSVQEAEVRQPFEARQARQLVDGLGSAVPGVPAEHVPKAAEGLLSAVHEARRRYILAGALHAN